MILPNKLTGIGRIGDEHLKTATESPPAILSQLPGATVEFFEPGLVEERLADCVSRQALDQTKSRLYEAPKKIGGVYIGIA